MYVCVCTPSYVNASEGSPTTIFGIMSFYYIAYKSAKKQGNPWGLFLNYVTIKLGVLSSTTSNTTWGMWYIGRLSPKERVFYNVLNVFFCQIQFFNHKKHFSNIKEVNKKNSQLFYGLLSYPLLIIINQN